MTSLSVIVVAHNHLEEVTECLATLQFMACREPEYPIEFIVADDASDKVFLPKHISPCAAMVVRRPDNGGFACNANTGAKYAKGDILFFCNQDVFAVHDDADGLPFSQDWNVPLVRAFDDPTVGIVGAKLITPDGNIQSAGGLYDAHCQPFHRCLGYSNHTFAEVNTPQEVSWVTGAALAIRRSLFEQVGGFDEGYVRGYFEDVSLCATVRELGYKVWYEPRCQLVHRVGTSGGSPYFMQNAMRFKEQWVDTKKVKPDSYTIKMGWW